MPTCPACGVQLGYTTEIGQGADEAKPEPGDHLICAYCATLLRFTPTLALRVVSNTEWAQLSLRERLAFTRAREAVQQMIAQRKREGW